MIPRQRNRRFQGISYRFFQNDAAELNEADDDWYKKESAYTDDNERMLEVLFDDEGMLEFAIDGLSVYYSTAYNYQQENNWKIYACDDGTVVI